MKLRKWVELMILFLLASCTGKRDGGVSSDYGAGAGTQSGNPQTGTLTLSVQSEDRCLAQGGVESISACLVSVQFIGPEGTTTADIYRTEGSRGKWVKFKDNPILNLEFLASMIPEVRKLFLNLGTDCEQDIYFKAVYCDGTVLPMGDEIFHRSSKISGPKVFKINHPDLYRVEQFNFFANASGVYDSFFNPLPSQPQELPDFGFDDFEVR